MKILLLDNAMDSLKWSVTHLKSFLKLDYDYEKPDKSTTHLKQAILTLNSSLELFLKYEISQCNELLIFREAKSDNLAMVFKEYYYKKNTEKLKVPLYDYVVLEDKLIRTIDYSNCITLYAELYDVPEQNVCDFIFLNGIRNELQHLGINNKKEYYKLAGCLSRILWFVQSNFLEKDIVSKHIRSNVITDLYSLQYTLSTIEDTIWRKMQNDKIENICIKFKKAFDTKSVQDYMVEKNVYAEFEVMVDYEPNAPALIFVGKDTNCRPFLAMYTDTESGALILADDELKDGPVFSTIVLENDRMFPDKFYTSKEITGTFVKDYCEQGQFWSGKYRNEFDKVPFGEKQLINVMNKVINYIAENGGNT